MCAYEWRRSDGADDDDVGVGVVSAAVVCAMVVAEFVDEARMEMMPSRQQQRRAMMLMDSRTRNFDGVREGEGENRWESAYAAVAVVAVAVAFVIVVVAGVIVVVVAIIIDEFVIGVIVFVIVFGVWRRMNREKKEKERHWHQTREFSALDAAAAAVAFDTRMNYTVDDHAAGAA